jgi:hypothetical protein
VSSPIPNGRRGGRITGGQARPPEVFCGWASAARAGLWARATQRRAMSSALLLRPATCEERLAEPAICTARLTREARGVFDCHQGATPRVATELELGSDDSYRVDNLLKTFASVHIVLL